MRYNIVNAADVQESGQRMDVWMKSQEQAEPAEPAAEAKAKFKRVPVAVTPAVPKESVPADEDDRFAKLERYALMHEKGLISDEEFTGMKSRLSKTR